MIVVVIITISGWITAVDLNTHKQLNWIVNGERIKHNEPEPGFKNLMKKKLTINKSNRVESRSAVFFGSFGSSMDLKLMWNCQKPKTKTKPHPKYFWTKILLMSREKCIHQVSEHILLLLQRFVMFLSLSLSYHIINSWLVDFLSLKNRENSYQSSMVVSVCVYSVV